MAYDSVTQEKLEPSLRTKRNTAPGVVAACDLARDIDRSGPRQDQAAMKKLDLIALE